MHVRPVLTVVLAIAVAIAAAARTPGSALASGEVQVSGGNVGLAGGGAPILLFYFGSTAAPGDTVGDAIRFSAVPAPGSAATPRFANGQATLTLPIGGAACGAARQALQGAVEPSKCFAAAGLLSTTPGIVDVAVQNTTAAGADPIRLVGTVRFVPPRLIVPGVTKNQQLVMMNTGGDPANLAVELFTSAGVPIGVRYTESNLPPGSNAFAISITQSFVPDDFAGVAIVGGDQPVAATHPVASVFGQAGLSQSVRISGSFPLVDSPAGSTVALPYVARRLDATYDTNFWVANAGPGFACVQLDYAFVPGAGAVGPQGKATIVDSGPGGGGCSAGYPVPPFGQLPVGGFNPLTASTVPGAILMPPGTENAQMAVTVRSTGSPVVAIVDAFATFPAFQKTASYEGFVASGPPALGGSDLGTSIAIPLALKTEDGFYSQVLLANPGSQPAQVTIAYAGSTGTHTATLTVPANGTANHSVYSDAVVPVGFLGAATVTSNVPVAAVLFRAKMTSAGSYVDEQIYSAVNGVPAAKAAREVHIPGLLRRILRGPGRDGQNSWVSVIVPGGGKAQLTIRTVALAAGPFCSEARVRTTTREITGSFVFYQNADVDSGFGPSPPECAWAGMTITSDVPVLAVAAWVLDSGPLGADTDALYGGFPKR